MFFLWIDAECWYKTSCWWVNFGGGLVSHPRPWAARNGARCWKPLGIKTFHRLRQPGSMHFPRTSCCFQPSNSTWKAMESHIHPGKKHLNYSCKQHLNDSQSTFPPCSSWWIRPAIAAATLGIPLRRCWQRLNNRVTCRGVHCYEPFLFRPQSVVTPPKQR